MHQPNRHTQLLFPFIYCLPDDIKEKIQPRYNNGKLRYIKYFLDVKIHKSFKTVKGKSNNQKRRRFVRLRNRKRKEIEVKYYNPEWIESNTGECIFYGLLFLENRVYALNIEILCKDKDYEPQYLEITETFDKLLKRYTIFHLCILISAVLRKKYYKEATLAKNLRTKVIYDQPYRLPKIRYGIQKHHSRERKFYCDTASQGFRRWDLLITEGLHEISNLSAFEISGKERHQPGLWTDYSSEPRLVSGSNKNKPSDGIRSEKPRKLRRGFFASHPQRR